MGWELGAPPPRCPRRSAPYPDQCRTPHEVNRKNYAHEYAYIYSTCTGILVYIYIHICTCIPLLMLICTHAASVAAVVSLRQASGMSTAHCLSARVSLLQFLYGETRFTADSRSKSVLPQALHDLLSEKKTAHSFLE